MKTQRPPELIARFEGNLRHYHRSGARTQRTWDDWVDGGTAKPPGARTKRLKYAAIALGIVTLGAIVVGLIVEMG